MAHNDQDVIDGWQTYFAWNDTLRDSSTILSQYDRDTNFEAKMLACDSNHDRFKLLWNDKVIFDEVARLYTSDSFGFDSKNKNRPPKSIEQSKKLRERGNKSFKDSKFEEALQYYTQAITFAPYPKQGSKDDTLALALANRSASLYALTRYRLCISDIDLAMKYGYPQASMFKLLIRKVKCLHILSVWANDVEQIKVDLKAKLQSSDTKDFIKTEIQNMFKFLEETLPENVEREELDVMDETTMRISNASKTVSQAADCVEMSFDGEKGRYLMTNKDVSFGRLLLSEEPYVALLAPSKRDRYCYNCLGRLYSCGLGCTKCIQVSYCSEKCLEDNSATHKYECNNFLDLQDKIGVASLVVQIMFKNDFNLDNIPVHTKKTVDKKSLDTVLKITPCDWPDLVYKNNYASVLSLMDHSRDFGYNEIMGFGLTAVYLMLAFIKQFSTVRPELLSPSTHLTIGPVILRHLMQLQTNLIAIIEQNAQKFTSRGYSLSGMQEIPIGVGIYPTISLLNHSCSPNVITVNHRNKMAVRASGPMECGTEINYCYGPSVARMSKKDRQRKLKEQYFFDCDCKSCVDGVENETRALLCPKCEGPVIYNQDMTSRCNHCRAENLIDVMKYRHREQEIQSIFTTISDDPISAKNSYHIEDLRRFEEELKGLLYWRHELFFKIKSDLVKFAEAIDDIELIMQISQEELDLIFKLHGPDSYEYCMTKIGWVNIRWRYLYEKISNSTEDTKPSAIAELKSHLVTIGETKGKLKELLSSTHIIGAESSFDMEMKFLTEIQNSINRFMADEDTTEQSTSSKQ